MVTRTQIDRLGSRIDALAVTMGAVPVTYCVELVWLQDDGSIADGDGKPWMPERDDIVLDFTSRRW